MSGRRQERVGDLIRDEVSDIIRRDVNDPRLGFVTITRAELSPDLRYARLFVSVFADDAERKQTLEVLNRASSFIRRTLAPRLRMRSIPELSFRLDQSMEHAESVARILRELETDEPSPATAPESDDELATP
ncbi:MAG TPA: 30S ribosome-binding factor RbfA [Thermomicrobiales bacterium]|nr:30S ribosome-binding factor RbfA [Thermomicrobiales bacterium]